MNPVLLLGVVALLPLTALITVCQRRPFYALICRGMMGAVATLIYAVLGAPDVALTEALMGTLLTILLYLIAVRASMMVKVGWLPGPEAAALEAETTCDRLFDPIRRCCREHLLEPELIPFDDPAAMHEAFRQGRIDAVFSPGVVAPHGEIPEGSQEEGRTLLMAPHAGSLFRLFVKSVKEETLAVRLQNHEDTLEDP